MGGGTIGVAPDRARLFSDLIEERLEERLLDVFGRRLDVGLFELGTFEVGEMLAVGDTCLVGSHLDGPPAEAVRLDGAERRGRMFFPARAGRWRAFAVACVVDGCRAGPAADLIVVAGGVRAAAKNRERVELDFLPVESGTMAVVDAAARDEDPLADPERAYRLCTLHPFGCVVPTLDGDGLFPVVVEAAAGRAVGAHVRFSPLRSLDPEAFEDEDEE